jgi:hypothetical protein
MKVVGWNEVAEIVDSFCARGVKVSVVSMVFCVIISSLHKASCCAVGVPEAAQPWLHTFEQATL